MFWTEDLIVRNDLEDQLYIVSQSLKFNPGQKYINNHPQCNTITCATNIYTKKFVYKICSFESKECWMNAENHNQNSQTACTQICSLEYFLQLAWVTQFTRSWNKLHCIIYCHYELATIWPALGPLCKSIKAAASHICRWWTNTAKTRAIQWVDTDKMRQAELQEKHRQSATGKCRLWLPQVSHDSYCAESKDSEMLCGGLQTSRDYMRILFSCHHQITNMFLSSRNSCLWAWNLTHGTKEKKDKHTKYFGTDF